MTTDCIEQLHPMPECCLAITRGRRNGHRGIQSQARLIDDPIRSRQDADNELIRDRVWDWYINDFKTRLIES